METYSLVSEQDDQPGEAYIGSCRRPHNPCQNNAICKQVKIASLLKTDHANFKVRIHCFCPDNETAELLTLCGFSRRSVAVDRNPDFIHMTYP